MIIKKCYVGIFYYLKERHRVGWINDISTVRLEISRRSTDTKCTHVNPRCNQINGDVHEKNVELVTRIVRSADIIKHWFVEFPETLTRRFISSLLIETSVVFRSTTTKFTNVGIQMLHTLQTITTDSSNFIQSYILIHNVLSPLSTHAFLSCSKIKKISVKFEYCFLFHVSFNYLTKGMYPCTERVRKKVYDRKYITVSNTYFLEHSPNKKITTAVRISN